MNSLSVRAMCDVPCILLLLFICPCHRTPIAVVSWSLPVQETRRPAGSQNRNDMQQLREPAKSRGESAVDTIAPGNRCRSTIAVWKGLKCCSASRMTGWRRDMPSAIPCLFDSTVVLDRRSTHPSLPEVRLSALASLIGLPPFLKTLTKQPDWHRPAEPLRLLSLSSWACLSCPTSRDSDSFGVLCGTNPARSSVV